MTVTASDIIVCALRAANTNRVVNTAATIATLYCELLQDGSRTDRYISLSHNGSRAYATDTPTAVFVPIDSWDGEPEAADDDDMIDASFDLLADLLAEQGGMLCLRDGTELRAATPKEIAESWIEDGAGMIETSHEGKPVEAFVEAFFGAI